MSRWRELLLFLVAAGLTIWLTLKDPPDWYWASYTGAVAVVAGTLLVMIWLHKRRLRDLEMTQQQWWRFGLTIQVLTIAAIGLNAVASGIVYSGMTSGAIAHDGPRGVGLPGIFAFSTVASAIFVVLLTVKLTFDWHKLDQIGKDPLSRPR